MDLIEFKKCCDNIVCSLSGEVRGFVYWKDNTIADSIRFYIDNPFRDMKFYINIPYENINKNAVSEIVKFIIKDYKKVILQQYFYHT